MAEFKGRGFKIHYIEEGEGPSVVFAHGFVMDRDMFVPQFEELPGRNRCVAWDMRGHGKSDCPPGPWTVQDTVVDLIAFIEDVNAAPCHLVGMSWGGWLALRVAIQREDLVRSVVLIDTSADAESPERAEMFRGFQATVRDHDGVSEELARSTLPLLYAQSYIDNQPDAISYHVDRVTKMKTEAVVEGLRAIIERDDVTDRLGEIRVPVLVIHGEQDASISLERGEAMAKGIGGAEMVKIPGAGHTTPLEAPDVVNEALGGFFSRVKR
jgi:pimeloyl-ACP methyl ester carboxylesterase